MLGEHLNQHVATREQPDNEPTRIAAEKRQWTSRMRTSITVRIKPGNSSDRHEPTLQGRCRDISATGCGIVSKFAPRVGDIYLIEFDQQSDVATSTAYARCVRCHLLGEDAFEAGFAFFQPQDLGQGESDIKDESPLI